MRNEPPVITTEPRCPTCGRWRSTRYDATWPHLCVTPSEGLRSLTNDVREAVREAARATVREAEAGRVAGGGTETIWFDRHGRAYPMPDEPPPAGPSVVFLAYCAGALSGCFVTLLISQLF